MRIVTKSIYLLPLALAIPFYLVNLNAENTRFAGYCPFTFEGATSNQKNIYIWCGDFVEKTLNLADRDGSKGLLLNSRGFLQANVVVLCDGTIKDENLTALVGHSSLETLVIHSSLVTSSGLNAVMGTCPKLREVRIDCPSTKMEEVDFNGLSTLSYVMYSDSRPKLKIGLDAQVYVEARRSQPAN